MDNVFLYLIGGAVIAVVIIFMNHKKQKTTVTNFLEEAQTTKPMFMQQAVEKKLRTLKTALFLNKPTLAMELETAGVDSQAVRSADAKRQALIAELNSLEKSFAAGSITLKQYDEQLSQLVMKLPQ